MSFFFVIHAIHSFFPVQFFRYVFEPQPPRPSGGTCITWQLNHQSRLIILFFLKNLIIHWMTMIYLRNIFLQKWNAGTIRRPVWHLDYKLRRKKCLSAVTFALGAALVGRWLDAVPDFPHGRGDSGCGQIRRFQPLELLVTSG